MKDYDVYLFDWDGTIAQTLAVWLKIVRGTLANYHAQLDDKVAVRQIFGRAEQGLLEAGVPSADLPKIFAQWDAEAQAQTLHAALYPGMRELLTTLKQRSKKLGVVTSTVQPVVHKQLVFHALQDAFDIVITGSDITAHKPDPEALLLALARLGSAGNDKSRVLMLGDSEKDILAARNAGLDSLLFYPSEHEPFHTLAELQADDPTYTVHSWRELANRLQ